MFHDILKRKNAFLERKKAVLNYKNKELNKTKNLDFFNIFWSTLLVKKFKNFPSFSFQQNRPEKCGSRYSRKKTNFSSL